MSRCCKVLSALLGIALVTLVICVALLFRGGVSARTHPSRAEVALARQLRHWLVPAQAAVRVNPIKATEAVIQRARAHFADHCASCHSNDGSGRTNLGQGLYPRAPDMRLPATQRLSDGELFWIIENGIRLTGMPAWHAAGAEGESWGLVHFIRRLPKLTDEEVLEMEAHNPRSPEEWREREEEERFLRGDEVHPSGASTPFDDGPKQHHH